MCRLPSLFLLVALGTTALVVVHGFVASPPAARCRGGGVSLPTTSPHPFPLRLRNSKLQWRHCSSQTFLSFNFGGSKEETTSSTVDTTTKNNSIFSFLPVNLGSSKEETTVEEDSIALALNVVTTELSSTLSPFANVLDEATDGWALTYADLSPETESTPAGISFLLTNVAYAIVGFLLTFKGDAVLGLLTEIAGVFSFFYHFCQLKLGPDQAAVRVALLVDYIVAGAAILTTGYYITTTGLDRVPIEGLIVGALGVVSLSLSWVWEVGYPYLFFHSIWHLLSAYAGYVVGQAHLAITT